MWYNLISRRIPRRKKTTTREDGSTEYEEYIDYLYPEESQTTNLKILEAAYKWKKQKLAASEEDYDYYQVSFELYQNCELIFFGLC